MKISQVHSHLNGYEYLMYHTPHLWHEIEHAVGSVDAERCRTKQSREARKIDQGLLYSPIDMNKEFKESFYSMGWQSEIVSNWITEDISTLRDIALLSPESQKRIIEQRGLNPIRTYNQTDFVKGEVAVEVQFGKYPFVAHDLFVKHLSFFLNGVIKVGIEIVPMKSLESRMSSGVPYYERDLFHMIRQGRGIPQVPIVLVGIEP